MKKLMLLGGSRYLLPVIKTAHSLGIHVITCDYLPNNIAHKYSDEYHNVSIVDKEAVLELARKLEIDGIMSFACDPGVVTAAYVAEKLSLPSCGPYESVCILQNKARFRRFLKENGFEVPWSKGYADIEEAMKDAVNFSWPVIVKPVDSAGSKGVSRVDHVNKLKESIKNALHYSLSNEFIIEDFIEKKGCSSDSDCFSVEGVLKFVSFSSQLFDKSSGNPYTPAAYSWPSTFSDHTETILKNEIQRLLKLLKMKTSIYNIETREGVDGKPYIMEISPRGGGNRLSEILRYATGVDLIKTAVLSSIGEPVEIKQENFKGCWAEVILHSNTVGVFKELIISQKIPAEIIEKDLWVNDGDSVGSFIGANEAIGTLVLRFKDKQNMIDCMNNIEKYVQVVVVNN